MDRTNPTTLSEALAYIGRTVDPVETFLISEVPGAWGYVLARDLFSPGPLPRFDNAARFSRTARTSSAD